LKEKEIQYEQIRKKTQDIIQGYKRISCLPKQAERGRTEAGSRNVEASCLIGIYDRTNTKDTKQLKELQESELEEWAKYENICFDHTDIRKNWKRIDDWTSKEAEVYGFKETKTVRKVFHYDAIDSDYYIVDDLHSGNILKMKNEDGIYEMFVIDPNPSLNTSKIKGGKSKYLPFRIVETIV